VAIDTKKYDEILARTCAEYGFSKKMASIFKAIIMVESSFMPRAYRFEPELFKTMKAKEPYWEDKDPSIVSASYGLSQILFTTAWVLGMKPANWKSLKHHEFQALAEKLYDPERNLMYQAQLMRSILDAVWKAKIPENYEHISAIDCALARYNGGSWKNPDDDGVLRNKKYVDKVWRALEEIRTKEALC
jgi:hypothetical protein